MLLLEGLIFTTQAIDAETINEIKTVITKKNSRKLINCSYSPRTCLKYFSLRKYPFCDSNMACKHPKFSLHADPTSAYYK